MTRLQKPELRHQLLAIMLLASTWEGFAANNQAGTTMKLESSSFTANSLMPAKLTCEGEDASPHLHWSGIPNGAKSLVLTIVDPDAPDPKAPRMTWVHWILYNLPPATGELPEGLQMAPKGSENGRNDWGTEGYRGPCPPVGNHRYIHQLYALDTLLPNLASPKLKDLEQAMQGHILAKAELTGLYEKQKN